MRGKRHLCLVFAAGFLALCSAADSALGASHAHRTSARTSLLQAVNAARVAHGVAPLQLDATLGRAAESHTLDMLRGNYFAHGDFSGRMVAFHLAGMLGENLAWGSGSYSGARAIVHMWLLSPEHRANLLRPGFRRVGLGIARGSFQGAGGATVVTADFGS
jgi:uncharacterized protein YkwD